jgi:hypothetical protein
VVQSKSVRLNIDITPVILNGASKSDKFSFDETLFR